MKFYCLDFEKFALSDDLYIKMNSRGKQLTDYEIFKAQFEKYIEQELNDKNLKYEIARLFDNDYTDLVWESQNRDKSKIDTAFLNLFKNLFTLINYVNKEGLVALDWNKSLFENIKLLNLNTDDISFITCFLDHFRYIQTDCPTFFDDHFYKSDMILASEDKQGKIRFFKSSEKVFCDACESILKNPQLVSLYALYVAIKNHKQKLDWFDNFRHVRNLIEFSDDELGHSDRLHNIFIEIENIIAGRIAEINSKDSKFNTTQYSEELVKNKNIDVWKDLFEYENHDILRGSLTLFAHPNDFSLENSITANTVINRLRSEERRVGKE